MISGGSMRSGKRSDHISMAFILMVSAVFFLAEDSRAQQTVAVDADVQFKYAQHLFSVRDFMSAVNEYRRFIYLFPRDGRVESAAYRIGLCYLSMEQPDLAIQAFAPIVDDIGNNAYAEQAYFRTSEAYLKLGRSGSALTTLHSLATLSDDPDIKDEAHYRIGWIYLETAQWEQARNYFGRISPKNSDKYRLKALTDAIEKRSAQPQKRPGLAGALSIVPGGGYLYCERYQDAFMAFLFNAGLIYAAYEAFDHELYALAGVISFVEIGFYSGNIYGSISSAHKYNQAKDRNLIDHLRENLKIQLSARPANRGMELSMCISF
jgi:tetratricopeptide (TPR) repeat protein